MEKNGLMYQLKGENGVILKEGNKFLINTNNYGLRAIIDAYDTVEIDDDIYSKIIECNYTNNKCSYNDG